MSFFRGRILPNKSAVVEGRVINQARELYEQADLSTISFTVVKQEDGSVVAGPTSLNVANVIFDTPFDWDGHRKQANFRHVIAHTVFTLDATVYEIQYTFTATDGTVGGAVVVVETEDPA